MQLLNSVKRLTLSVYRDHGGLLGCMRTKFCSGKQRQQKIWEGFAVKNETEKKQGGEKESTKQEETTFKLSLIKNY